MSPGRLLITFLLIFIIASTSVGQQNPSAEIFFGELRDIREMERVRLLGRPDSADFYSIFIDSFADKALAYNRCWYKYGGYNFPDTLSDNFENVLLKEINVETYSPNDWSIEFPKRLDTAKILFRDLNIKIYNIKRGDGSHWVYFARYWIYVNGRWVSLESLDTLLNTVLNNNKAVCN